MSHLNLQSIVCNNVKIEIVCCYEFQKQWCHNNDLTNNAVQHIKASIGRLSMSRVPLRNWIKAVTVCLTLSCHRMISHVCILDALWANESTLIVQISLNCADAIVANLNSINCKSFRTHSYCARTPSLGPQVF